MSARKKSKRRRERRHARPHGKTPAKTVFCMMPKKGSRLPTTMMLADPGKMTSPILTLERGRARVFISRQGGYKLMARHPHLRKKFRVVPITA